MLEINLKNLLLTIEHAPNHNEDINGLRQYRAIRTIKSADLLLKLFDVIHVYEQQFLTWTGLCLTENQALLQKKHVLKM